MAVEFGKWQKIERKELTPPIPFGVEKIEIIFTTYGSKNDGSGAMNNEGMVYGEKYRFKISYANNTPPETKNIVWEFSYKTRDGKLVSKSFDGPIFNCDNLDYCGQTISFYAYLKNKQTTKAKLDVFCHYRFKWIDRNNLKNQLSSRKTNPYIDQGDSSLCGIAVIAYLLCKNDYNTYEQYISDMHQYGEATIKKTDYSIKIDSDEHLLNYKTTDKEYPKQSSFYNSHLPIWEVDFVFLTTIRDHLNDFWDYDPDALNVGGTEEGLAGLSLPKDVAKMMKKILGYSKIINNTNLFTSKWNGAKDSFTELSSKLTNGYKIALLIESKNFTNNKKEFISKPTHWVILEKISINESKKTITLEVFTWAEIKSWTVSFEVFKDGYYGYVAGK